jgi:hypothetical protein
VLTLDGRVISSGENVTIRVSYEPLSATVDVEAAMPPTRRACATGYRTAC